MTVQLSSKDEKSSGAHHCHDDRLFMENHQNDARLDDRPPPCVTADMNFLVWAWLLERFTAPLACL